MVNARELDFYNPSSFPLCCIRIKNWSRSYILKRKSEIRTIEMIGKGATEGTQRARNMFRNVSQFHDVINWTYSHTCILHACTYDLMEMIEERGPALSISLGHKVLKWSHLIFKIKSWRKTVLRKNLTARIIYTLF